jgi:uncharacterized protein YndB with AHSA1/START domain
MESREPETRSIEVTTEIAAPADVVWRALTEAEQLENWFPLNAQVEPGVGGSIRVSWGGASAYGSRITTWEPGRHLQLTDQEADPQAGLPLPIVQDYYLEGKGGTTVLRFVHSGFSPDAQWDEMFDTMSSGWAYFFYNLRHYLERHRGVPRAMVWRRQPVSGMPRAEAWPALLDALDAGGAAGTGDTVLLPLAGERLEGEIVQWKPPVHLAARIPDLNDALLFVEFESSAEKWHAGFWLSMYGVEAGRVEALQRSLDALTEGLLPAPA